MTRTPIIRGAPRGFTLVELIIAILVLGMGLVFLAAVFPAGIAQQQFANDDVYGRVVAEHALSVLRKKVAPEDFGSFEEFYLQDQRSTGGSGAPVSVYKTSSGDTRGVSGDWSWKRPGFVFDSAATPLDEGKIDVFSWERTRLGLGVVPQAALSPGEAMWPVDGSLARATEFPQSLVATTGVPFALQPVSRHQLFGIPYSRARYDADLNVQTANTEIFGFSTTPPFTPFIRAREPAVFVTQADRVWPQGSGTRSNPAQYVWECMFRRHEGKIQVAIFVYRVAPPGGEPRPYTVAQAATGALGQPQGNVQLPPLPVTVVLSPPWDPNAANPDLPPGGAANSAYNPADDRDAWQLPGQWIVDKFGNVHRVLNGRRMRADGPVRLARRMPLPVGGVAGGAPASVVGQPFNANPGDYRTDQIWYLPGRDAAGNSLIPVFCTVQEL